MLSRLLLAVTTEFLAAPHVHPHDPPPYPLPDNSCYGNYQTDQRSRSASGSLRLPGGIGPSDRIIATDRAMPLLLGKRRATPALSLFCWPQLWLAGEYAYAAGDRTLACALVARGSIELDIVGEWMHQARRDLRGNWSPWEVAGGYRAPLRPDRPCPRNRPGNPTDPMPHVH